MLVGCGGICPPHPPLRTRGKMSYILGKMMEQQCRYVDVSQNCLLCLLQAARNQREVEGQKGLVRHLWASLRNNVSSQPLRNN